MAHRFMSRVFVVFAIACTFGCTRVDRVSVATPYGWADVKETEGVFSSSSETRVRRRADLDDCIQRHEAAWGADVDLKCREALEVPSRRELFYGPYGWGHPSTGAEALMR